MGDDNIESGNGTTASRLLEVAAALFRKKGYGATTTRELADALGIRKASLYHHIDGKEDLLYQISLESLRRIMTAIEEAEADAAPERRLQAMIAAHVETALRDRDMHTTMLTELRSLSTRRRAAMIEERDRYERTLRNAIRRDQEAGRLRTDYDAEFLTLMLLNLLNWTIFWYDPHGDLPAEELGRRMADIFFNGASSTTPAI